VQVPTKTICTIERGDAVRSVGQRDARPEPRKIEGDLTLVVSVGIGGHRSRILDVARNEVFRGPMIEWEHRCLRARFDHQAREHKTIVNVE
jgi:hypothetical protein